ncbi:MAG: hypothetical protein ACRDY4_09860 [Acidimicrobiia bacterium]
MPPASHPAPEDVFEHSSHMSHHEQTEDLLQTRRDFPTDVE